MFSVGLTGNLASGKSTAIKCFESLGIPVVSADVIARDLTAPGQPALAAIQQHLGDACILDSGQLNRAAVRELIFTEPRQRIWLEGLLHPLIKDEIKRQIQNSQGPYCVVEIPLLKDRQSYPYLNRILVILAEKEQQIARVMARDHCSKEQAQAILATQPDDQARRELADDLIINRGSIRQLEQQIKILHTNYLHLAAENES
ncbi:dephospho-CoA kinase [Legionella sp. CNM-4043-24]|uniref:dephospho-CoA kinase n=1 Tax=Legionella sp. CNM-4043-24 TaxID=3421646 RepID=UPI00403AE9FC